MKVELKFFAPLFSKKMIKDKAKYIREKNSEYEKLNESRAKVFCPSFFQKRGQATAKPSTLAVVQGQSPAR